VPYLAIRIRGLSRRLSGVATLTDRRKSPLGFNPDRRIG